MLLFKLSWLEHVYYSTISKPCETTQKYGYKKASDILELGNSFSQWFVIALQIRKNNVLQYKVGASFMNCH